MENRKISGGDIVELKSGKIVKVDDIRKKGGSLKEDYIVVAFDEWYPFSEIKAIVEPFH